MPSVTVQEVEEIALLARLRLAPDEAERLRDELAAILDHVAQLAAVDTTGVEPMTHAVPLDCPLRPDEAAPSLTVDEALGDAPDRVDDFFAVPRVIDVGGEEG